MPPRLLWNRAAVLLLKPRATGAPDRALRARTRPQVMPQPFGILREGKGRPVNLGILLWTVMILFAVGELALAVMRRARSGVVRNADAGSTGLLRLVVLISIGAAVGSQWVPSSRLHGPRWLFTGAALALLCWGLALRWVAVLQLGRFFTVDVAIHEGHTLVDRGLYRFVRHPSYLGLLLGLGGLALFFGTWISLLTLTVPIAVVALRRIRLEEKALLESFGPPYARYCAKTARLFPGVY